jgi:uncharacterized protein
MAVEVLLRRILRSKQVACESTATAQVFEPADFSPALKTRLLILQPTPFCNIDCDYCYLPDRTSRARMNLGTIRSAVRRLVDDALVGSALTVVWHAGEPLALPPAFYDEAIPAIQEVLKDSCEVSHSIQTNATLIDDRWCALIKRYEIRVGVSVDGPAGLHDAHRKTRGGRGTHHLVVRGMRRLHEQGIEFHAIAVVTPTTFTQADAFLDFFETHGVREVCCNFDEAEGVHSESSLTGHEAAHVEFLARLLARTSAPQAALRIRELTTAYGLVADPLPRYTWQGVEWPDNAQVLPFALVSVAHDGDFSTFSPELLGQPSREYGDFAFGNVAEGGYLASTRGERFNRVWNAIARGIRQCERECAYFGFCGGGSPVNKLYENGSLASGETLYCRTMVKRPFDTVLAHLESRMPQN